MQDKMINSEYEEMLEYYKQVRVFVKGRKGVQDYIQNVVALSAPNSATRNKEYKKRAKYVNFAKRTRDGLVGSVFRKEPILELPSSLEYLETNVNGAGLTSTQLVKSLLNNNVEVGRHGLFVDYGIGRPKIVEYKAENMPYWETDENGELSLVKLLKNKDEYKLLRLKDGVYIIEFYKDDEKINTLTPTKKDGSTFNYIPFIFIGSMNNSPDIDDMPLWSIVDVSQGHLQNSADYEDLLKYLIPTPYVTVPNKQWMEDMLPGGVYTFGDGGVIPIPEGGSAGILQAEANQMHAEAMKDKENQLVMIGARMIQDGSQAETAEAVRIKFGSENSILDNIVGNAESAMLTCFKWCADYENMPDADIEYKLNREYYDTNMTAQEISALILLADRGDIAQTDVRANLRKTGVIASDRTDEDIDEDNINNPSGL